MMDYEDYLAGKTKENFWFKAKNELINKQLSKVNKKNPKVLILNLGVGLGSEMETLNKFGEVYVIDINGKALDLIPEGLCKEKEVMDACDLKYPSNFFDIVTSFDVFEHIEDDCKAIREVKRVLKKDGVLIFSVPAFQSLYGPHDKALGHKRRYSKKELKLLLADFEEVSLSHWNFTLFIPTALMRLIKRKSKPKVDNPSFPKFINYILFRILKFEGTLIEDDITLPFGLSIVGIYKKEIEK